MPPAPKPAATRQRLNRATSAATLVAPAIARAALPERTDWHDLTLAWWSTIWASPMVGEWVDADVPGLILLADLVNRYWMDGDPKIAAEIRLQQREFGLSPLSRRSLQWEVKRVEAVKVTPAPVKVRDPRLRAVG